MGGVACYVRNNLSYIEKDFFPEKIENIFFEILLPKTKPITVRIIYGLLNQNNSLQTLNGNFAKLDSLKKELYILGDFNINLCQNHTGCKNNALVSTTVSNDVKNYLQFCTMFRWSQIIKSPSRITCSSASSIDHILASLTDKISQEGVINVVLSDQQLVYCTRKISRIKIGGLHEKIKFRHLRITQMMLTL